jgi:hypothetical protein
MGLTPFATKLLENQLQERLVSVGSGPAQLLDLAFRSLCRQRFRNRFGDVSHIRGLQLHIATAWTWHRTHKITASAIVHASVNFTWPSFLSGLRALAAPRWQLQDRRGRRLAMPSAVRRLRRI